MDELDTYTPEQFANMSKHCETCTCGVRHNPPTYYVWRKMGTTDFFAVDGETAIFERTDPLAQVAPAGYEMVQVETAYTSPLYTSPLMVGTASGPVRLPSPQTLAHTDGSGR